MYSHKQSGPNEFLSYKVANHTCVCTYLGISKLYICKYIIIHVVTPITIQVCNTIESLKCIFCENIRKCSYVCSYMRSYIGSQERS